MTEPLSELPRVSTSRGGPPTAEPGGPDNPPGGADADTEPADESPPGTSRWVKLLGIVLVVLLVAFAGLHLTGNAPTHMGGGSGAQHDMELP
jgi:hypothetical protein